MQLFITCSGEHYTRTVIVRMQDPLKQIYFQYEKLKLGFVDTSLENLFFGFHHYASTVPLRPGEGARILYLMQEISSFLEEVRIVNHTMLNLTRTVISVLDVISAVPEALIHPKVSIL